MKNNNLELDVIVSTDSGNPQRLHLEYLPDEKKITLQLFDTEGNSSMEKVKIANKTLLNFGRSVEEIRRFNP